LLRAFRTAVHACFHRRADALFELTDALLAAESVTSLPHVSLQAAHRRGWGSLYDALAEGHLDVATLRTLLNRHVASDEHPVYAIDLSVWPRCDAETSPERGYSYHPSRHSAGQPIVAGWAYQWLAQLNGRADRWTTPLDVQRLHPRQNATTVAVEQIKDLLGRLAPGGAPPLVVFDAGYDAVQLTQGLDPLPVAVLVRLRAGRCFYAAPHRRWLLLRAVVRVSTARNSPAPIPQPGPDQVPSTSPPTSSTAPCVCAPGRGCIPSITPTRVAARVRGAPSCAGRVSSSR
jgi:DDE superfamily endonuclease